MGGVGRPWQPGQSGNPAGRAKGPDVMRELYRQLQLTISPDDQRTVVEALVSALIAKALAGSAEHMKAILDRLAPIKMIVEGSAEDSLPIVRIFAANAASRAPEGGEDLPVVDVRRADG